MTVDTPESPDLAAGLQGRRVPEAAPLGLALIGGSPSAMLAMVVLRHKTRKPAFLIPFALIVLAQALAVAAWLRWLRGAIR